jgi:FkbM family methyltransferase
MRAFIGVSKDEFDHRMMNWICENFTAFGRFAEESPLSGKTYCRDYYLQGSEFTFYDGFLSTVIGVVGYEINESPEYDFHRITFKKGDVVVDIGGNIGMVSILLAKKYPFLKIYAYEPVKANYENFLRNIKANGIPEGTITVENKAVTADGRPVGMHVRPSDMAYCTMTSSESDEATEKATSMTLADIFKKHKIEKLKLLKIDCEGAEYEILEAADDKLLTKIEYLRGEFHGRVRDIKKLIKYCKAHIPHVLVWKNC